MAFGPTQNYDDASLGVWQGRPVLAGAIRTLIATVPVLLAVGLGLAAVHWFPPQRLGVNPWLWLVVEISCATLVLILASRALRKLLSIRSRASANTFRTITRRPAVSSPRRRWSCSRCKVT